MGEDIKRTIPAGIRRQLRQEAFFGCCKCGSAILDYHHIIEFAEKAHHDPDHIIALCPTCHRMMGKLRRERCYELKRNPYNKERGKLRGELGTDAEFTSFLVGSCTYIETPIIFEYYRQPIIKYYIEDGQVLLDIYIPQDDMWPDILIQKNDVIVNSEDKWDLDFRTNFLKVQKREGESYFQIDLRSDVAKIEGKFSIMGQEFKFSPSSTNLGGLTISNSTFIRNGCGIGVGDDRHKLFWPNYAMAVPRAVFIPTR